MIEYFSKEEVMDVVRGVERDCMLFPENDTKAVIAQLRKQLNRLYTIRPVMTSTWKTLGNRKDVVFCGGCGFKTMAYKMTPYCPNCGKKMVNGRKADDQK